MFECNGSDKFFFKSHKQELMELIHLLKKTVDSLTRLSKWTLNLFLHLSAPSHVFSGKSNLFTFKVKEQHLKIQIHLLYLWRAEGLQQLIAELEVFNSLFWAFWVRFVISANRIMRVLHLMCLQYSTTTHLNDESGKQSSLCSWEQQKSKPCWKWRAHSLDLDFNMNLKKCRYNPYSLHLWLENRKDYTWYYSLLSIPQCCPGLGWISYFNWPEIHTEGMCYYKNPPCCIRN